MSTDTPNHFEEESVIDPNAALDAEAAADARAEEDHTDALAEVLSTTREEDELQKSIEAHAFTTSANAIYDELNREILGITYPEDMPENPL
ncbi:hypothetical protein HOF56_00755 [Candidatus Peribacteria bacterium]|jgi:hypothetical protein|nr:hypothetical protein [Candidatus Peribacteria bacterium]MBT4021136.1 hypothetical protein [Candidatus Peribacteria bacterium]MBT4240868.1 hypothetical protein [Candidatus Peribacteria bacterium]MBT4474654.1 hypothetical protein [Candidatus Peribacteria bacterium]